MTQHLKRTRDDLSNLIIEDGPVREGSSVLGRWCKWRNPCPDSGLESGPSSGSWAFLKEAERCAALEMWVTESNSGHLHMQRPHIHSKPNFPFANFYNGTDGNF
jgi:hypothetical protein